MRSRTMKFSKNPPDLYISSASVYKHLYFLFRKDTDVSIDLFNNIVKMSFSY